MKIRLDKWKCFETLHGHKLKQALHQSSRASQQKLDAYMMTLILAKKNGCTIRDGQETC